MNEERPINPEASMLRAWERPQLTRYGAVAEVTAKVDLSGTNDGGTLLMRRT